MKKIKKKHNSIGTDQRSNRKFIETDANHEKKNRTINKKDLIWILDN